MLGIKFNLLTKSITNILGQNSSLKSYHLHKDDYSKLQLDIHDAKPYCDKYAEHCYVAHMHTYYQIIWFSTPGRHFVDYQEYEHQANTCFFLAPGQIHNFCRDSENAGYLFHFNEIFLSRNDKDALLHIQYRLFNEFEKPFIQLSQEQQVELQYITSKLRQEMDAKEHNYREQLYYYFQILILNLERLRQEEDHSWQTDPHFELAMGFKKAIEKYKGEFHNVQYFSEVLGTTEKTLSVVSKKYFHETPANFIHKKKVLEAKRLLSHTSRSIKEVAYELGFEQATYFTKYFKKHTSLTPKEFQAQIR